MGNVPLIEFFPCPAPMDAKAGVVHVLHELAHVVHWQLDGPQPQEPALHGPRFQRIQAMLLSRRVPIWDAMPPFPCEGGRMEPCITGP